MKPSLFVYNSLQKECEFILLEMCVYLFLQFNDSDTEEHEDDVMDTTAFSSQAEGEASELMDPTASTNADSKDVSERVSSVLDSYLHKTVAEGKEHESLDQTISSDLQSDQAEESNVSVHSIQLCWLSISTLPSNLPHFCSTRIVLDMSIIVHVES